MTPSYISKLEKCKVNITIDTLEKIAEILEVRLVDFLK
ncbi:MAG: helix-turn-helix transcriptional regulator [Cyanobacteria bacterium SIG27]|nr:helix-turn-helix transcriptional regulator [Cyanobacteria bacterium SIG27]